MPSGRADLPFRPRSNAFLTPASSPRANNWRSNGTWPKPITIPIIADVDTGYGNALNVMRTVNEQERAGVAAICIEDNVYPKRCSFYAGVRRELIPIEEHCGKINAAKAAQTIPDFVVIARTEALIAGWGQEEALSGQKPMLKPAQTQC